MNKAPQRYLIPAEQADVKEITQALNLVKALSRSEGLPKKVVLLIPTQANLDHTTLSVALSGILGSGVTKSLLQGNAVALGGGSTLTLKTLKTFQPYGHFDIMCAVYANQKMLDAIDSAHDIEVVIVVPWMMQDVAEWTKTWNPQIPGQESTDAKPLITSPIVEEGLRMLTSSINISNGLSTTRNKGEALDLLRALTENGETYDPASIKAWALRHNWTPMGANQLSELAQGVLDGKKYQGGGTKSQRNGIIRRLRATFANP